MKTTYHIFIFLFVLIQHTLCAESQLLNMGKHSYGMPSVYTWGEGTFVTIGSYCSIAGEVKIFLGGEHRPDWVSTFPFTAFWPHVTQGIQGHPKSKGNVMIGNDVWIGNGALILSGVTIGDGAVIGAHAVVAKDVPSYAIVAGNPGRIIRYRFDPVTVDKLKKIAWWKWPEKEIEKAIPLMLSTDIQAFIKYCERSGKL